MMPNDVEIRKLIYFQALIEIVQLWGQTEIGDCEVDVEAVAAYVNSDKFNLIDMWGVGADKDAIYQHITDDILAGFPIWQLLKVSPWTKSMLERSFRASVERSEAELRAKYKCYTCKHYSCRETALGTLEKCVRPKTNTRGREPSEWRGRAEAFSPKKKCKYYEEVGED